MVAAGAEGNMQVRRRMAVFDVDGTIIRGDTFRLFCWFVARRNGVRSDWLCYRLLDALMYSVGRLDAGRFKLNWLKTLLNGCEPRALLSLISEFVERILLYRVYAMAVDRLRGHQQANYTIIFLSAAPDLYLDQFGSRYRVDHIICTKCIDHEGQFTGELYSANCRGGEKKRRLLDGYPPAEVAWDESYGYGNSVDDVPFLELLGNPIAVNPDRKLRKIALQRNWPIEIWR